MTTVEFVFMALPPRMRRNARQCSAFPHAWPPLSPSRATRGHVVSTGSVAARYCWRASDCVYHQSCFKCCKRNTCNTSSRRSSYVGLPSRSRRYSLEPLLVCRAQQFFRCFSLACHSSRHAHGLIQCTATHLRAPADSALAPSVDVSLCTMYEYTFSGFGFQMLSVS